MDCTILSLFDLTGNWPRPWLEAGYRVEQVDLKQGQDVLKVDARWLDWLVSVCPVYGLLAAPPCTDFAVSGAQYWKAKDRDGTTRQALRLVDKTLWIVRQLKKRGGLAFWVMENPVGRLNTLRPELKQYGPWYFDPCTYAGHLNPGPEVVRRLARIRRKQGQDVTPEEVQYIWTWNAYTKRTGLWGEFDRRLSALPIAPVKTCSQGSPTQTLGGKSERTKELRSATPMGFARAFFQANCRLFE